MSVAAVVTAVSGIECLMALGEKRDFGNFSDVIQPPFEQETMIVNGVVWVRVAMVAL